MSYPEFPHEVVVLAKKKVSDGGGGSITDWFPVFPKPIEGFMDTPTSKEKYIALQMSNQLDRYFYFLYRKDISADMRIRFEEDEYELTGKPEDQGGQHVIMRVALKLVVT